MQDTTHNIQTHDFAFQDVGASFTNLPGIYVTAPPLPWNQAAVSAHANAAVVANFLSAVLGRHGLDDRGSPLVSSINCVWAANGSTGHWPNSYWDQGPRVLATDSESLERSLAPLPQP